MAYLRTGFIALVASAVIGGGAYVGVSGSTAAQDAPLAGPVVKLMDKGGHGSGVHIGGGYVLTAAHVTGKAAAMAYLRDDGKKGTATVLWENTTYDIALTRIERAAGMEAAPLDCRTPGKGEAVALRGNPIILENITTWGKVAGAAVKLGPWGNVIPVDASIAGGMSGGGLFDVDGDLVGINVGMMMQQGGLGLTSVGLSLIVPAETICGLLAR